MPDDAAAPFQFVDRQWRWWTAFFWLSASAIFLWQNWAQIRGFGLGDTDDNMRMMQVRAWLSGQGWYDLRQYRMNPPAGADIHWSRLVDLPIAGLKIAFAPFFGGANAERIAVAVAPLLPMGVAFAGIAVAVRRLIAPQAFALAIAILLCAHSARGLWRRAGRRHRFGLFAVRFLREPPAGLRRAVAGLAVGAGRGRGDRRLP